MVWSLFLTLWLQVGVARSLFLNSLVKGWKHAEFVFELSGERLEWCGVCFRALGLKAGMARRLFLGYVVEGWNGLEFVFSSLVEGWLGVKFVFGLSGEWSEWRGNSSETL